MAYEAHTWLVGEPITQEKMNHIENGIKDTNQMQRDIDALDTRVQEASTLANSNKTRIDGIDGQLASFDTQYGQGSTNGSAAWGQILAATTEHQGTTYANLDTRFSTDEDKISKLDTNLGVVEGMIDAARIRTAKDGTVTDTFNNIVARLNDTDSDLATYRGYVEILRDDYKAAKGYKPDGTQYATLNERISVDESKFNTLQSEIASARLPNTSTLKEHFDAIDNTISEALESSAYGKTGSNAYTSLDARFEAVEREVVGARGNLSTVDGRLDNIENNMSTLSSNKVSTSAIANNLNTTSEGFVLDARQGKELEDKKVNYTDIKDNLTSDDADKPLSAKQGKALKGLIDSMDTAYKAADTALDGRLDTVESDLNTASTGLKARMSTAESDIDTIESDLNTTTTGLKARMTAAENDIDSLEEIVTTPTTGLVAKVGALETTVNDSTDGLVTKVSALETNVNDSTTGLAATKAIADEALTKANAAAVAATVNTALGNLDTRLNAIDGGTALTGANTLAQRVTSLENEPKSATEIVSALPQTGDATKDYLLGPDEDGKYFYYKWIEDDAEDNWKLISGGSGSGSSSGMILSELPAVAEGDANIDYFIGTDANGYIHYRFIAPAAGESNGHYVRILPGALINALEVNAVSIDEASAADKWPESQTFSGGLEAYAFDDANHENNLLSDFVAVRNARITATYDENDKLQSQKLQVLDTNGKLMEYDIVGGGGDGGTTNIYSGRIDSSTALSRSIPSNSTDPVYITATAIIQQGNTILPNATAEGIIQYRRRNTTTWYSGSRIEVNADNEDDKYTILNNTPFTVDITNYLQEDDVTMEFRIALTAYPAGEENTLEIYSSTFRVAKVNIYITDESFDYASLKDSNFRFNYRCFGNNISKTVHFVMDGTDIATANVGTSHNTVLHQDISMTGKENGMHTFQVYFVTSAGLESNRLNYYILYNTDATREAPLLGAAAENTNIVDGDELIVNYSVYVKNSETVDSVEIELYTMENDVKNSISTTTLHKVDSNKLVDPPYRTFDYPPLRKDNQNDPDPEPETVYVKLTATHNGLSDSQIIQVTVNFLHTTYDLEPKGTQNLIYKYSTYGRSNNNIGNNTYIYPYKTVSGQTINFNTTFNNFNWSTDGYLDGESLTIGGGATVNINVPIFNSKYDNISIEENNSIEKITTNGRTIEIDYEVLAATNLGETIIDCMTTGATPKGFRVTPQNCYLLNSGSNIDIDETGFIKNEENVAAAYLNPGTRNHLTFVIEPIATTLASDNSYHQSTNIYINGEFANTCPYDITGNDFDNNATITIGSDTCLIKLYSVKLYNRGLTEEQVLHNYMVSPVATRDKLTHLKDNDVLNNQGTVDYEKARKKYTCLLLTGMGTVGGQVVPTMAPYKGYPSVVGRTKDNEIVGKTESGLLLTKPTTENMDGYTIEFDLQDRLIDPNNQYGYASSNNVQGTSSQKFPVKNLKVYLAKGDDSNVIAFDMAQNISVKKVYKYSINTAAVKAYQSVYGSSATAPDYITDCGNNIADIVKNLSAVPTQAEVITLIEEYLNSNDTSVGAAYATYSTGDELITHPILGYKKSKKVKYALRDGGIGESTLCWKADYMSTDHANTFNANIANTLYGTDDRLSDRWTDQTQFTVYGIKCLLFQQNGDGVPEFVGDGCLNNDKGNNTTFGLETGEIPGVWQGDEDDNTMCQKWDFRNNTGSLLYFKHDGLFETIDNKPAVTRELECIYPDEGDLADIGKVPNYNHFQILSSWLGNRANYWYESNAEKRANKKNIFINEFTNHFNFNHILIYYLFMEYTALCDNRVKNIHMRTDNAGEEKIRIKNTDNYYFEGNSNPNSGPWTLAENLETRTVQEPIMDENGDYQFNQNGEMELGNVSHVFVTDTVLDTIDWEQGEGHSNFAIWAPTLYDLDSCFSVDNVGYLKIRYDADWDYSLYNKLKFAGFDSILWLQVEDCFQDELKAMAKRLYDRVVGLNYSTFYRQQIVDNLASLCPAITNQDMILKYDKPWTEGFLDYSKNPPVPSTDKYKYLQRGTRTGQKAMFMKQRSLFLSSKYDANEFIQDKITFRAGTQVNYENSVLTLVANQKLYPGAQFGDVNDVAKVTRRASEIYDEGTDSWIPITDGLVPELTPCRIQHSGNMNNTDGIEIYGASVLNDIGDISKFHPWQLKVGGAVNLKRLILGSDAAGFSNTSTNEIDGLNACILLEEINVCNLKNLTSLQLGNNGFIKKVYATGSGLNTLALPRGGVLDTIAYGANTTDITIINQSRLQNFSYENSETNNYANLTRLWVENTPTVPIVEIVSRALAQFKTGGLRLIGIDIDLGENPSFLQLITSDLAKGTRLSASGGHIEGTEEYPIITGTIHINAIRDSLLAKLNELYPDLVIDYNTTIQEFSVKYVDEDGDEDHPLFTYYGTNQIAGSVDYIIDPVFDINPITNEPYLSMPTKDPDEQFIYKFGLYNNQNKYRRFTGWVKKGTTTNPTANEPISQDIVLVAVYPTTEDQYYDVTWYYERNGQQSTTKSVKYGTDMSSESSPIELGTMPRVRIVGNTTKVFKGWSCPLGKIKHDVNVYGLWEESTIDDNTGNIVMSNLNAADIYALSRLKSDRKSELLSEELGSTITIPMGQQYDYVEGVNITNLLGNEEQINLDGTTDTIQIYNNIRPLSTNSDWTLALDYKFLMDNADNFNDTEYVLASCYQNANSSIVGFKVSLIKSASSNIHEVQVSWGTSTQIIDYVTTDNSQADWVFNAYRNVVVLSHNSDEPNNLRISYRIPNLGNNVPYGSNQSTTLTNTILTWDSNTPINMPLIIGGNYVGTTTKIEEISTTRSPAQGVIYWAKYWDTDLGSVNCGYLAAWPHETVRFYLTGYNGAGTRNGRTEQIYANSTLSFAAAQGLGDRYFYPGSGTIDSNGFFGWHQSKMRTICNDVIYYGLPESYRSIIAHQTVESLKHYCGETSQAPQSQHVYPPSTEDYLFLIARREIDESITPSTGEERQEVSTSWYGPWGFMGSRTIYTLVNLTNNTFEATVSNDKRYHLYRFIGACITDSTRIFSTIARPDTINNLSIKTSNGNQPTTIQSGDVWVDTGNSNVAYIYRSADEIANGMVVDIKTFNNRGVLIGGWKQADEWALRTANTNMQSAQEFHFIYVNAAGVLQTYTSQGLRNAPRLLCPEFTI